MKDLSSLQPIRIPRCYFAISNNPLVFELHGFSDASCKAYAAVVYLRTVYVYGGCDIQLVASKTRVVPVKKQSIPRLELLGAVILARLVNCIRKAITSLPVVPKVILWTDSYTVFCWIRNSRAWKTYVKNRVNEIRDLTYVTEWKFCPGERNPADLPSRGCKASELLECKTWWNGPAFLRLSKDDWPSEPSHDEKADQQVKEELVKPKSQSQITRSLVNVKVSSTLDLDKIVDCSRYHTKTKLLRVTAYVKRFVDISRRRVRPISAELTAEEIRQAEDMWLRSIQHSHFTEEYDHLFNLSVKQPSLLARQLGLFHDEERVIRCQGRIDQSDVSQTTKQPVLLPSKHRFTDLVILEHHNSVHHNGIRDTLNSVREKYWIVRGREVVKRVIRPCIVCKRIEGKPFGTPIKPQLPLSRVSDAPPFANTGIDFAGPLYVRSKSQDKSNGAMEKAYVCLLTCASTRALHLELVPNLSVATFLQAFRPFVARRGLPSRILSDNAKMFKGGAREIKKIVRSANVLRYMADKGVTWEFIVEKAPWHGGFWERLVRCVKRCLKKIVGRAFLSFEEMRTLLIEIEGTLNNRPLTYVYDDEQGISYPLTPSSLIYGRTIATTASDKQYEILSTNQALTRRERYHRTLLKQFAKQWRSEYLTSLLETARATSGAESRVCIINDGGKRTILRRPVQHLIPLEVRSQSSTTEEDVQPSAVTNERPRRKAAEMCEAARKDFFKHC